MLTPHDLAQIARLVRSASDSFESRLNSKMSIQETHIINKITKSMDIKIDLFAEQILEYTNSLRDSHEGLLKDLEKRIIKLENQKLS